MIDFTAGTCPRCGGRLYIEVHYPDDVRCDTCDWPGVDRLMDDGANVSHNRSEAAADDAGARETGEAVC